MQKFVVVEIITQTDGRIAAPVNAFEEEPLALSKYYSVCAQASKSSYPVHSVMLMSGEAFEIKHECFKHAQPEPDPEPAEEDHGNDTEA